jgi:regulatory protein
MNDFANNNNLKTAKHLVVKLLARREHSKVELRHKLSQRGYADEIIDEALQWLAKSALQSDAKFAQAYIAMRSRRGFGPLCIAHELQQRGIDKEVIADYLPTDCEYWLPFATREHDKWCKNKSITSVAERVKLTRFLQRRGFSGEQIKCLMINQRYF